MLILHCALSFIAGGIVTAFFAGHVINKLCDKLAEMIKEGEF